MDRWVTYALLAAVFAGLTAVLAKHGLDGISPQLGLVVRTALLFVLAVFFGWAAVPHAEWANLTRTNYLWLGVSAVTTFLSWVFYYAALKGGDVGTVALLDKGSFVVAVLLGWLVLGEKLTPQTLLGAGLILAGVVVAGWKR